MNYSMKYLCLLACCLAISACQQVSSGEQNPENLATTAEILPTSPENMEQQMISDNTAALANDKSSVPPKMSSEAASIPQKISKDNEVNQPIQKVSEITADFWKVADEMEQFIIHPNQSAMITLKQGTIIEVPENAFVISQTNEPVNGTVSLIAKEYRTIEDCIAAGITTMSDKGMLESGGMLYLDAMYEGQKCKLAEGKEIDVAMPTWGTKKSDMKLFTGDRNEQGQVEWKLMTNKEGGYLSHEKANVLVNKSRKKTVEEEVVAGKPTQFSRKNNWYLNYKTDFNTFLFTSMNITGMQDVCADKMRNFFFPKKEKKNFTTQKPVYYRIEADNYLVQAEAEMPIPKDYELITGKEFSSLSIQTAKQRFSSETDVRMGRLLYQDTKGTLIAKPEQTICRVYLESDISGTADRVRIRWSNMFLTPQMKKEVVEYVKKREWKPRLKGVANIEIFMSKKDAKRYAKFLPTGFSNEEECMAFYEKEFQQFLVSTQKLKKEKLDENNQQSRKQVKAFEKAISNSTSNTDEGSLIYYTFHSAYLGWINCDRFRNEPNYPLVIDAGKADKVFTTVVFHQINALLSKEHTNTNAVSVSLPKDHEVSILIIKTLNRKKYYALSHFVTTDKKNNVLTPTHFEELTLEKLKELSASFTMKA